MYCISIANNCKEWQNKMVRRLRRTRHDRGKISTCQCQTLKKEKWWRREGRVGSRASCELALSLSRFAVNPRKLSWFTVNWTVNWSENKYLCYLFHPKEYLCAREPGLFHLFHSLSYFPLHLTPFWAAITVHNPYLNIVKQWKGPQM